MNELQRIEPGAVTTQREPRDLLELAVEKGADVATLERLMVVRTQLKAEKAKEAYFAALAAFQSECPIILRTQTGHENRYRYAPLERIVKEVAPLLHKHGFAHQSDGKVTDGWVESIVTVTHRDGHTEVKSFKVPAESKSGMSPAQKYGAAMTYATRYAFCAAFGIRTGDKDTDCPPGGEESVTQLKGKLWALLKPHHADIGKAQQWCWDEMCLDPEKKMSDLDIDGLKETIRLVTKRLAKGKGA